MFAITHSATHIQEAELIRQIIDGQGDSFAELIGPHLKSLTRVVRAASGGHPDAEDIVQQTALKAFLHLDQFRFQASFRTWLIRIGVNEARQWRRKHACSPVQEHALPELTEALAADPNRSPLVECQKGETVGKVRQAVAKLPEKYRIVIFLRDLQELSLTEVATRLGLSVPAVKTRHLRARRKVATILRANTELQSSCRKVTTAFQNIQ